MSGEYCNVLGNKWYNKCWRAYFSDIYIHIGETIGVFLNILPICEIIEIVTVVLYFLDIEEKEELLDIFHYVHRLFLVPLCTILGLYMIFKQRRPCGIPGTNHTIGSIYGMPSGDSLTSAIFATVFFPYSPLISTILFLIVPFSRVARGFHSILQVIVGSIFGILIGLGTKYGGDIFCILNWIAAMTLPLLTLFDKNMNTQKKYDPYNFCTWMLSNSGMWMIDMAMCPPKSLDMLSAYDKRIVAVVSYIITSALRIGQFVLCEEGWVFTFVKKTKD